MDSFVVSRLSHFLSQLLSNPLTVFLDAKRGLIEIWRLFFCRPREKEPLFVDSGKANKSRPPAKTRAFPGFLLPLGKKEEENFISRKHFGFVRYSNRSSSFL